MDFNLVNSAICNEKLDVDKQILKRKLIDCSEKECSKKLKSKAAKSLDAFEYETIEENKQNKFSSIEITDGKGGNLKNLTKAPSSPKKRLDVAKSADKIQPNKEKFIYGNYSQYYGYRNNGHHDIRLDVFQEHKNIFENKLLLDIGCNSGFITVEVAKRFEVKSIVGLDIDKSLINQATKNLLKLKKSLPLDSEFKRLHKFPFNIKFLHCNYVLKDDILLEIETSQFDVILCLSITKWIHLNFGDNGLKQAFKRMFLQLRPQGKLILEAQPYDNYGRRKKMTVSFN